MRKIVPILTATLAALATLGAPALAQAEPDDCESQIEDADSQVRSAQDELQNANQQVRDDEAALAHAQAAAGSSTSGAQADYNNALKKYNSVKTKADGIQSAIDALQQKKSRLQDELDSLPADDQSDGTAIGFFNSIGATDAANFLQNNPHLSEARVNFNDPDDATALKNMLIGLRRMQEINRDRESDDNFPGRGPLPTSPYMMAMAAITADEARYSMDHKGWYQVYENLSWGYPDPVRGWYNEEKQKYDSGNHNYSDTGHYQNIMSDNLLQAAVGHAIGGDWGVNDSMDGDIDGISDQSATSVEDMIDELQNYIASTTTGSTGSSSQRSSLQKQINDLDSQISDKQSDYDNAQDKVEAAQQALDDARNALDNTSGGDDSAVSDAESRLAQARQEQENARQAVSDAQDNRSQVEEQCPVVDISTHRVIVLADGGLDITYLGDGTQLTAPATPKSRKGYTFVGWSTSRDGAPISFPYDVTEDMTLYPVWEKNPSTSPSGKNQGGKNTHPGKPSQSGKGNTGNKGGKNNKGNSGDNTGSRTYDDVHPGDWFYAAVEEAGRKGLMTGYNNGLFGPYDSITREQAALTLYRAAGKPDPGLSVLAFPDGYRVDNWASDAVAWAVHNNVIHGYGPEGAYVPFGPLDTLTRGQCATILARINGDPAPSVEDGMSWAVAHGVIHGWPDRRGLDPNGRVDRAQMAQILVNASNNGYLKISK